MFFLFPVIYVWSFIIALVQIFRNRQDGVLLFLVFGLPIYITSLSVSFMYGFSAALPVLQAFKEIIIIACLGSLLYNIKRKISFHLFDKLVLIYFFYTLAYVFLPVGSFSFFEKLIAFKSLSFFPLIYFTGRLFPVSAINLNKAFHYICIVAIAAAVVLLFEIIPYQHLQTYTGYADYYYYYYDVVPAGHYNLTWTFEAESGMKRFASFFANPLENAAATLVSLSVLAAMVTDENNRIHLNRFNQLTLVCTLLSVAFALSRASFASYFIIIYIYAHITEKKLLLKIFHSIFLIAAIACLFWIQGDLVDFIINTIDFSNSSSLSHLIEWVEGVQAISTHPLGLGLGSSGRIAGALGVNVGGENELIIIGVQAGFIAVALYIAMYVHLIRTAIRNFKTRKGKTRRLSLVIVLLKIGLIIPLFTAEVESYIYISYITWFFSGLLITQVTEHVASGKIETRHAATN